MLDVLKSLTIKTVMAQENINQELIPCQDGTIADPTIGCTKAPSAIVNAQSNLLDIIIMAADGISSMVAIGSIISLIYGGILYVMSAGNEDQLKKAKRVLIWSTFGLILALLAKYIVFGILVVTK